MRRREFVKEGIGALAVVGAMPVWAKRDWERPDRSAEEVDSSGLGYDELNALMDRIESKHVAQFEKSRPEFQATGGQRVHLNVFNAATLRDAQKNHGKHEDLQVRVCGWNVRWNDLSKDEQNHFIATMEAQE